jgi:hypothetical protein
MHYVRSMRGGFIARNRGPLLKVHHGHCLTSMTKHDASGSPPEAAKPPHLPSGRKREAIPKVPGRIGGI